MRAWYRVLRLEKRWELVAEFSTFDDAVAYLAWLRATEKKTSFRFSTHPDMPRKTFAQAIADRGIDEKDAIRKVRAQRCRQLRAW